MDKNSTNTRKIFPNTGYIKKNGSKAPYFMILPVDLVMRRGKIQAKVSSVWQNVENIGENRKIGVKLTWKWRIIDQTNPRISFGFPSTISSALMLTSRT